MENHGAPRVVLVDVVVALPQPPLRVGDARGSPSTRHARPILEAFDWSSFTLASVSAACHARTSKPHPI
jgi:hypothetical protein